MDHDMGNVLEHVKLYFKENLPKYTVLEIRRKTNHPGDSYLWMVSAEKEDGTFAVWTAWNESTQSLNHGHYDIQSLEDCEKLMLEYIDSTSYFAVYRCSQKTRFQMFVTDSEEQARQFCESHGWEWKDENDFLWSLDYRELQNI